MDLSIIIINWNSSQYLRECLGSIYRNSDHISFEIIVLDNGSFDGCGQMLAREYPGVIFIQSEQNLGFARGNNMAASHAAGDTLLFLNPDTNLYGSPLPALLHTLNSLPQAGSVGARLLNTDGTLQTSCVQPFPSIFNLLFDAYLLRKATPNARIWGMTQSLAAAKTPGAVETISGACLMTRRKVFQEVGGFTEDYFMYYEDTDYCLKVHRAGWKNYFVPNATVTHHGGKSGGQSRFSAVMMAESAWRFFIKWRGRRYANLFRIGLAAKAVSRIAILAVYSLVCPSRFRRWTKPARDKWVNVLSWCAGREPWVVAYPDTQY